MRIKDDCGSWVDDRETIAQTFITAYEARFKSSYQGARPLPYLGLAKLVTDDDNRSLIRMPTLDEIKQALFSIDANKTPGPDGFSAGFFQTYWNIVGTDFSHGILEFFQTGRMLREINHTFITLIPKTDNPSLTSRHRPISLCSTIYKTIVKIVVNRMRPLLDKLVSPYQSAFIPTRSIHDNILLTHEILHKFKNCKGKTAWAALKIDIKKAYDRLEWDFITKCLQELGFHPQWIHWILTCVSSVSYSLLNDGEPKGFFHPTRCIR